jgi:predicted  nucleic acid-binding Zn-ribbon protein
VSDDVRKRVAQAEQEVAEALERAAEAGRALLDAEARAAADRAAAALAEDALAELRATSGAREDELRAEIARLEGVLEQHRQWLVSIQSSTSWKITKPLRSLSRG